MPRSLALCFLACLARVAVGAGWHVADLRDEGSPLISLLHRHVELEQAQTGSHISLDLALFSQNSCRLRIIDNRDGSSDLPAVIGRGPDFFAAINGGYFDEQFAPLGLRLVDGKITSRLTRGRLLTGVIGCNGITRIFRVGEFSFDHKWQNALECGPLLVDFARTVHGLESSRVARRTFAATGSKDRVALGFCPKATLADLGSILAVALGDFKVDRALNLDGGSSSAFYFKAQDGRVLYYPEEKPVRDFIAVDRR